MRKERNFFFCIFRYFRIESPHILSVLPIAAREGKGLSFELCAVKSPT